MVYTLLNASAVGFDIVRRPAAGRLASVLIIALTASPELLEELAKRRPSAGSAGMEQREWPTTSAAMRHGSPVRGDDSGRSPGRTDLDPAGHRALMSLALGGADKLTSFTATDVLGASPAFDAVPQTVRMLAADRIAEAVAAEWAAEADDSPSSAYADIRRAADRGPLLTVSLGPNTTKLTELLTGLPTSDVEWAQLESSLAPRPSPIDWSQAMHEATWAAWLTGRGMTAALAQLLAVVLVAEGGADAGQLAAWIWNFVSGMVAATVVEDLLPAEASEVLLCWAPTHQDRAHQSTTY